MPFIHDGKDTMNHASRDLDEYSRQYQVLAFESIQIEYRRSLVLRKIAQCKPGRLLEVGCGTRPLFTDLPTDMDITVVEPAKAFADHAKVLASGRSRAKVQQGFMESVDLGTTEFDMIILSGVLHEVPDPTSMLRAIREHCTNSTTLHVNVPNALSLHRLLAVAMGLIETPSCHSQTQRRMQQRDTPYDPQSLRNELLSSGFSVVDEGSYFIKPFTHDQMQTLVDSGFMTNAMLNGLDKLIDWLPDLGSEIWAHALRNE